MIALIREGYERSSTFRELVDTSSAVEHDRAGAAGGSCAGGTYSIVPCVGERFTLERHIRIVVDTRASHNG